VLKVAFHGTAIYPTGHCKVEATRVVGAVGGVKVPAQRATHLVIRNSSTYAFTKTALSLVEPIVSLSVFVETAAAEEKVTVATPSR